MIGDVIRIEDDEGMSTIKEFFKDGVADEMNIIVFSTSGVHGSYCTIEDFERGESEFITFLIIKPRAVSMLYGNCIPECDDDVDLLKRLRESSRAEFNNMGTDWEMEQGK